MKRPEAVQDKMASGTRPIIVEELRGHHVVKVACGIGLSIALTDEGRVYTWGNTFSARNLGSSDTTINTQKPLLLRSISSQRVCDVACGGAHTLLATESGEVYSFGSGEGGALGHGFFTGDLKSPKRQAITFSLAFPDVLAPK